MPVVVATVTPKPPDTTRGPADVVLLNAVPAGDPATGRLDP